MRTRRHPHTTVDGDSAGTGSNVGIVDPTSHSVGSPSRVSRSTSRHPQHVSLDTDEARRRQTTQETRMQVALGQWNPSNINPPPVLRSTPQIVLQNPGSMVVYDPPAHELVVYQQPTPLITSASPLDHNPMNDLPMAAAGAVQLHPFHQRIRIEEPADGFGSYNQPRVCRLCHRPFTRWDTYSRDPDDYDMPGDLQHFTSNDYFHLLAATEQAADASREHSSRASDADEEVEEDTPQQQRSRHRRRPLRAPAKSGVEVVEEDEEKSETKNSERPTRSRRATTGGRTTRSGASIRLSTSSSGDDLRMHDESTGPSASASASEAASEQAEEEDEDEVLECGLKRSSFNSGYYAKFFREECKLGAGGVGGVYLTHHVLDNVRLGTYAVKKIPVGNSRPWLLQVLKEVRALEGLHHRHIVAYKHSWLESFKPSDFGPEVPCLFLLMEYANRGTLANLIWPKPKSGVSAAAARRAGAAGSSSTQPPHVMPEEEVWSIFIGTLLGLRHLHRANVIHRDLKPENLLLASEVDALGRETSLRVLVSDFGNAILKGVPYNRTGNTGTLAYSAPETLIPQHEFAARLANATGTPASSPMGFSGAAAGRFGLSSAAASADTHNPLGGSSGSPISVSTSPVGVHTPARTTLTIAYDEACDLWSCGVILYAMAFGKLPFLSNSPEALFQEMRSSAGVVPMPSHPQRSPEMLRMIRELLSIDPTQRPSLDDLLNRPAILQRREQRYAEAAQRAGGLGNVIQPRPTVYSHDRLGAETYRPPPNALVISPLLTATQAPRRARSVSPAPIHLGEAAVPDDSPSGPVHRRRGSLDGRSTSASGALVVSRISLVEEEVLSQSMILLRRAVDTAFHTLLSVTHRLTGYHVFSPTTCWRCQWSSTAEAMAHIWSFLLKLWLSLTVLLGAPTTTSMYGHVFPQVFLTLILVFTSILSNPSDVFAFSVKLANKHVGLQFVRRMQLWFVANLFRWQLLRISFSVTVFLLSLYWLLATDSSWFWHGLNVFVLWIECLAILCTFFATHSSHTSIHPSGFSPSRASAIHRTRSPLRPVSTTPSTPGTPIEAPIPLTGAPVARIPLLLPPVRTPLPSEPDVQPPPSGSNSRSTRRRQHATEQPVRLIEEARRLR